MTEKHEGRNVRIVSGINGAPVWGGEGRWKRGRGRKRETHLVGLYAHGMRPLYAGRLERVR